MVQALAAARRLHLSPRNLPRTLRPTQVSSAHLICYGRNLLIILSPDTAASDFTNNVAVRLAQDRQNSLPSADCSCKHCVLLCVHITNVAK